MYLEENSSRLVALGRVYEGSTTVHNIPLLHGQVKVGVEEVKDAEALVPVPTDEVILVGQALNMNLDWPTNGFFTVIIWVFFSRSDQCN